MTNDQLPFVSVVMPIRNEAKYIERSLGAVLRQDYPANRLEVLVVDGRSTDASRDIVTRLAGRYANVRLLDNPRQIQAAALNVGIRAAQGDIIVRVDGHTFIEPDYVSACVRHLLAGDADNVGGMMRAQGETSVGQAVALATTSPFGIGGSKFHYTDQSHYIDTVYLGAYWRKTLLDIGLLDEEFVINEDYELNIRLRQAGGRILLSPAVKSSYVVRASLVDLWRQYFRYGRWKTRTLRKHPASLQWRQLAAPLFVAALLINGLVGLFLKPFRWLFGAVTGSYLLANLLASTIAARRGGWKYLPLLPLVFAAIHFGWGLGFLAGLVWSPEQRRRE
jgi:cellulose synthase/poly-beta-1,6-N-acetylglucosamine synthase-like glycosyltransferase